MVGSTIREGVTIFLGLTDGGGNMARLLRQFLAGHLGRDASQRHDNGHFDVMTRLRKQVLRFFALNGGLALDHFRGPAGDLRILGDEIEQAFSRWDGAEGVQGALGAGEGWCAPAPGGHQTVSGSFQVTLTATATAPGLFVNPRAGLPCQVDPTGQVIESNEGNNACSDQVRSGPDLAATKTNNVSLNQGRSSASRISLPMAQSEYLTAPSRPEPEGMSMRPSG